MDNKKIRDLNKQFFDRDYPTNVISFSYMDGLSSEVMGDIVISLEKAREEGEFLSIPFHERLFALIVHGIVHILGFDHVNDKKEARRMRYREKKLLAFVTSHPLYRQLTKDSNLKTPTSPNPKLNNSKLKTDISACRFSAAS